MNNRDLISHFDGTDNWVGVYEGIMPPSDDKPLPTPYVRLGKKWRKSPALINGIPADEYIRQHPEPPH